MGYALFQLDKNISIVYRKQQRDRLHNSIQIPPSYDTRQRDCITLPRRETFLKSYLWACCPPKQKKQLSNRPSGPEIKHSNQYLHLTPPVWDATCWKLWNIFSMLVITTQPRSGPCLAEPTLSLSRHIGEYIPAIALMPLEVVFNKDPLSASTPSG